MQRRERTSPLSLLCVALILAIQPACAQRAFSERPPPRYSLLSGREDPATAAGALVVGGAVLIIAAAGSAAAELWRSLRFHTEPGVPWDSEEGLRLRMLP